MKNSVVSGCLALIGFMAAGKSAVGAALAERLDIPFIDLDAQVAAQAGATISRIFAELGEEEFRRLETRTLQTCLESPGNFVLATGGGVVLNQGNRHLLRQNATCIFLDPPWPILRKRLRTSCDRPLAIGRSAKELHLLWETRRHLYQEVANVICPVCETLDGSVDAICLALGVPSFTA